MIVTSRVPVRIDFAGAWTDVDIFASRSGGAVVNAAIDRYIEGRLEVSDVGLQLSYQSDLPTGSGLGTSSAMNVCWVSLVRSGLDPADTPPERIAEIACKLEQALGVLGGKQDQYAAALGGFNYLRFSDHVDVERLDVASETVAELESRLVLCYTGKSRLSSSIHEHVWGAFERGVPGTVNALRALRSGAASMRLALLDGDIARFGELIGESWSNQKTLDASVTNERIESLFEVAKRAGADHGKACGAGGGGCLLFFARPGRTDSVAAALEQNGARVIPFHFDFEGLQVNREGGD